MSVIKMTIVRGCALALTGLLGWSAKAAMLIGSVNLTPGSSEDLTADGPVDWAIWDYQAGSAGTSGAPSNRKSGGSAISNVTAALGTPRGITGTVPASTFTYTNGTSPVSATNVLIGAITDTSINLANSGIKFNVTGDPGVVEGVKVIVSGFNAIGTFTATLNGAPVYTDSSASYAATRRPVAYTLQFQPDSASDLLQISYTIGTLNTGGNANVDLQAVAVSVPEPISMGWVGLAGAMLLGRRRARA
jgi:hypothetical protein